MYTDKGVILYKCHPSIITIFQVPWAADVVFVLGDLKIYNFINCIDYKG